MSVVPDEVKNALAEADLLFGEAEVEAAIERMAVAINARLAGANPLVYCVMNGGLIVTGKLLPQLAFPLEAEYLHATRYGHRLYGTVLDWKVKPARDMRDRTVLIVDDILDEGATLAAIIDYCREHGAREVLTAVLVNKLHDRKARPELVCDFVGLEVEDRYLFGYGMDYQGYWRNARGIYALKGH
ncbi:hypoxanthine-guanine phosphoribosyltransferase [Geotalea uraniireducens]|uniref:Hypoxanthine-guanine phosphoribosyltransferase n=1 Tax=Geotalea uraniireducens TaxID=351604 RepID=A0ABN6VVX5_9BACT|nr:hypoxanthine-guanine phosphoribosyltransferase [Geotalea uraniireducens]BDV42285.1 hypoxanthine-guanine phosphoribosyltransferase [Geotalea uraniireducens]